MGEDFPTRELSAQMLRFRLVFPTPGDDAWDAMLLRDPYDETQAAEILTANGYYPRLFSLPRQKKGRTVLRYEDLHVDPKPPPKPRPDPLEDLYPPEETAADLYDRRNGLGRYWNPMLGHGVKPPTSPDYRLAKAEPSVGLALLSLYGVLLDEVE